MCMYDDAETVEPIEDGHYVTARKDHKCHECKRTIKAGEKYHTEAHFYEGFVRHKTCAHCMVARGWLSDECGGWVFGGVYEDMREHCNYGQYPIGVYRLAVGMRRRWARPDGSLRPLPARPPTTHERLAAQRATLS